jgi:hypothetical protein
MPGYVPKLIDEDEMDSSVEEDGVYNPVDDDKMEMMLRKKWEMEMMI